MIKRIFIASVLAVGMLSVSACQKSTSTIDVNGVQQAAISICKFEPTAQTVLSIFGSGSPVLTTVSAIASAICNAVQAPTVGRDLKPPEVNGVPVQGRRV